MAKTKKVITVYADDMALAKLEKFQEKYNVSSMSQAFLTALNLAVDTDMTINSDLDDKLKLLKREMIDFTVKQDHLLESKLKNEIETVVKRLLRDILGR